MECSLKSLHKGCIYPSTVTETSENLQCTLFKSVQFTLHLHFIKARKGWHELIILG